MRAVLMREFGAEGVLRLEEVEPPRPGPGEVLVRVAAVEVSRTRDIATRTGKHPFSRAVTLPHVLGGDFAGVVEEAGEGVDRGLLGRRVACSATQTCGECEACESGHEERCAELSLLGVHRRGSYAELAVVAAAIVHPIPDDLPMAEAAAMAADGPIALTQLDVAGAGEGSGLLVTGVTGALGSTLAALGGRLGAAVLGLSR
ncbi:MAG: alcohol dehydrogenase catalytic domain-containing protein, partial [Solirubrobacterales bacterium]